MAKRTKKRATVLLLTGGRETTHRGPTLQKALAAAKNARLPKECSVKWTKMRKLNSVAGGEGVVKCPRSSRDGDIIYFIAIRRRKFKRGS